MDPHRSCPTVAEREQNREVGEVELPSGTVTFLFTDLEGSTRLWERHPEAMRPALERHDAILREAVEANDGVVVKTTGDGLHAVFTTTRTAVAAALAAQRRLGAEAWDVPGGLRVRMGLHTGDAAARGGDYYGAATNRAARVMASAHGGQVVVSNATEEILRDALPDDIGLLDLGEHRLPDLARPERIFQVVVEDLPREFPPLRSRDTVPGNLPSQLTSLVGRAVEREAIADALLASRLVTVTGVGGVGKSRIATQVAVDLAPRFADGAWLCELATAHNEGDLAQVVAATLGVVARASTTLEASIVDALRMRELILVLDNCEHVVVAVGHLVEGLLRDCPGVRVLATSREPLGLQGEQLWPLTALEPPSPDSDVEEMMASAAVQLFAERARAVHPTFVLDESNVRDVAEICRRLDGIPLAVELAAARVTIMTPADIAARLDDRFQLLTGGRRGVSERHQTLRGTIEWSYEMLDERERAVFVQLAAFPGSFDVDAAIAVGVHGDLEVWDVLDACAGLVAKSMLTADEATGTTRYHMLETLRTFAREQLDASGHEATFRRHAEHYARVAEAAEAGLDGPDELVWRRRISVEFENLRAAFIRCFELGGDDDKRRALSIVASLSFEAMDDRGLRVGVWAEHVLPWVDLATPAVRLAVLAAAAYSAQGRDDTDAMRELTDAALREGVVPNSKGAVWARVARASYEGMTTGDFARSVEVLQQAEKDFTAANEPLRNLSLLYAHAANFYRLLGDRTAAKAEATRALEGARRSHNPTALVTALFATAFSNAADDPVGAAKALDECIELARTGPGGGLLGFALARRGALRANEGDLTGARSDTREALRNGFERGDRPMLASALQCAMPALVAMGRVEAAAVVSGARRSNATGGRRERLGAIVSDLRIEESLAEARDALGDDAYQRAVARGAELSIDDAVTFALDALDAAELAAR
jgi:predicted ATPase/class 3 adenylate cyclase